MKFEQIKEEDFSLFLDNHPLKSFLQTKEIGEIRKKDNWEVYYVGLIKSKKIIAASMIVAKKNFLNKKIFYAPRGVLIDYKNHELVKIFFKELKTFIQKNNGYVFKMDPYYELQERDINGDIVKNGFNNEKDLNYLKNLGFKLLEKSEQMSFMFALNLENKTIEDIKKDFRQNTRNIINKTLKLPIKIKELEKKELKLFKNLTNETSKRKNFNDRSLDYYESMYELFKPKNQIKYLIAYINLNEYIDNLNNEINEQKNKLNILSANKSNDGKRKEIKITIDSLYKKIEEAKNMKKEDGEEIILSGGMFILYGDEVVYLFSGNYKKYMNFNAQYKIQWEMIKYALENNFKKYNFYGITGNFDKKDKDYGMYEFKKGFNGYVIELIGELELPITKEYYIHNSLSKIKQVLKGK